MDSKGRLEGILAHGNLLNSQYRISRTSSGLKVTTKKISHLRNRFDSRSNTLSFHYEILTHNA